METEKSDLREIGDVNLIGYLLTVGIKYVNRPKISPRSIVFAFKRTPELEEHLKKFYERDAQVDALSLCENLRIIKSMVREFRG